MALDLNYLPAPTNEAQGEIEPANIPAYLKSMAPQATPAESRAVPMPGYLQMGGLPEIVPPQTGFGASVKRGAAGTFAALSGLVGAEGARESALEYASQFPREIQDFTQIKDFADLGTYALESGAENVSNFLAQAVGGVIGGIAGGPPGALAGVTTVGAALQAGEARETQLAEGLEPTIGSIAGPTVLNTALDTFGLLKVGKAAGVLDNVVEATEKASQSSGLVKRAQAVPGAAATGFTVEGSTEALQTYNNAVAVNLMQDQDFKDALIAQGQQPLEIIDAFLRGGFSGGGVSGIGAAITGGPSESVEKLDPKVQTGGTNAAPVQEGESTEDSATTRAKPVEGVATPAETVSDINKGRKEGLEAEVTTPPTQSIIDDLRVQLDEKITAITAPEEEVPSSISGIQLAESRKTAATDRDLWTLPIAPASFAGKEGTFLSTEGLEQTVPLSAVATSAQPTTYVSGFLDSTSEETRRNLRDTLEDFRRKFTPDIPLILSDTRLAGKANERVLGAYINLDMDGKEVGHISLNLAEIETAAAKVADPESDNYDSIVRASIFNTLSHEFGHNIINTQFRKSDTAVKKGIYTEYRNWLSSLEKKTFRDYVTDRYPATTAKGILNAVKGLDSLNAVTVIDTVFDAETRDYLLSFDEYAAEQIARHMDRKQEWREETPPEVRAFWEEAFARLRELFKELKSKFAPQAKMEAWLEGMVISNKIAELEKSLPPKSDKLDAGTEQFSKNMEGDFSNIPKVPLYNAERFTAFTREIYPDEKAVEQVKREYRVSTGFKRLWGTMLTPLQIAERYKIPEAARYMERVQEYMTTKMQGISGADTITRRWMSLSNSRANNFSKFLFEVSERSDAKGEKLTETELDDLADKYDLNDEEFTLYQDIESSFEEILDRLYLSVVKDTARGRVEDPADFARRYLATNNPNAQSQLAFDQIIDKEEYIKFLADLSMISDRFSSLRNRNYFPRMRFGSYTVSIYKYTTTEKGKGKKEVEEFYTFETQRERDKFYKQVESQYRNDPTRDIVASKLDDTARSLYGMPQIVVEKVTKALENSGQGLSNEQKILLDQINRDLSPGKRFLNNMQKRKNLAGFSEDAMRTYAAYIQNASNHLARIEHAPDMIQALADLRDARSGYAGDLTDLAELESYYRDHFKYLLNPENDWAKLRSLGFLWYLGFNVKSALVNLTQIPMVTYPYLSAKFGDKKATKSLASAYSRITSHMAKRSKLTDAEQRMLDKLTQEGIIDESFASELGGLAESTTLSRILPDARMDRWTNKLTYYGGYMFGIAEKYNRRVTALAAFNLSFEKTKNFDTAFSEAKKAVQTTQFEYAKWNRPEFMRGRKSAFFLFYGYTQQFLYLLFAGDKNKEARSQAKRMWAMLFVLAGLQGLPFAEYILSTIDFMGTRFKRLFGLADPRVDIRRDIRELLQELGANPDLIMHGAGRYMGAGPLKVAELFGAPIPNLDISGSLSLGTPLPNLNPAYSEDLGDLLLNGLGPIPNIATTLYENVASTDPDVWKRTEKTLPVALQNASKAARFAIREGETTKGGALFLPYDGADPMEAAEIIAQGLGFTATRLSQKRAVYGEQHTSALYWTTRRQLLMTDYAYAVKTGDKDARREVLQKIRDFNQSLEAAELRPYKISNANLRASLQRKLEILQRRERGLPVKESDMLIYRAVEESF